MRRLQLPFRRLTSLVMISALAVLGLSDTAYGQESETTLDEYWALLEETQSTLDQIAESGLESSRTTLLALAERWAAITVVVTPDGDRIVVDHSPLVNLLQATPADVEAMAAQIATLRTLHERDIAARIDDANAVAELGDILSRPEFQWQEPEPTLWQQLRERVLRLFFNMLPDQVGDARLSTVLFAAAGLLLLLLLLYYAARTLRRDFTSASARDDEREAARSLRADHALAQAQTLSEQGDYRQAVRYLYLSTLLLLDERGLLPYDRTRTNREYLLGVAHRPQLAIVLEEIIEIFERSWYGLQVPDAQTYSRFESQVQDLRKIR